MAWDIQRILYAERFGWTLEYIDALDILEVVSIAAVLEGRGKANAR